MKKVRIDFAPPSLARTVFRAPRTTWSLLFGALVLVPSLLTSVLHYRDELQRHERRVAQLAAATAAASAPAPVVARAPLPAAQVGAVNATVRQLNLPWRALHDAVAAATPATVALLALEPDAKKSSVRITAETRSSDDMIAYVEQLRAVDWFSGVLLTRHEINDQDPNRPIRFQIDAQWRAAQ
jgi:Tfp pilus assembly protein PilN